MKLQRIFCSIIIFCGFFLIYSRVEAAYPLGSEVVFYTCEGSNATTTNSGTGGSTYDGTLSGNASTTSAVAKFGSKSCAFGETGDYLKTYFGNTINPTTQSISVSFWVYKYNTCNTGDDDHVFGVSGSPTANRWYIRCRTSTTNKWGYRVQGNAEVFSTNTVTSSGWDHVVLVTNASTDQATFYVNGTAIGSPVAYTTYTLPGNFYVGNFNDTVGGDLTQGGAAYMDDIAIYDTALTASDVSALYSAGTSPNQVTGLAATPYEGKVFLSWTAAGGTLTDYKIEYKLSSDSTWTTFNDGVSSTTASTTVTGLTNGSSYDFRVTTLNNALEATPSATVTTSPFYRIAFISPTITDSSTTTNSSITAYASSTNLTASTTQYIRITTPGGSVVSQVATTTRYGDYNVRHLDTITANSDLSLAVNSSGIAYVPTTGTLFIVHNAAAGSDSTIDEVDTSGALIRTITCTTCGDIEGITLISSTASTSVGGYDHTFMISSENDTANAEIYRVIIHSTGVVTVNKNDYFDTGITHAANGGLEGIAYNPTSGVFYVARELSSPALYEVTLGAGHSTVTNQICSGLSWDASVSDFSDLAYNNGVLYVLSENTNPSKLVPVNITSTSSCSYVDSDEDGDVSSSDTGNWLTSLAVGVTDQAEGVTWDSTGDYLYVLGEADFLAKYRTNRFTTRNVFSNVADGSYLLTSYFIDTNGITSNALSRTFGIDATGPVISAIASTTDSTTANVTWTTDESSNSKVSYGTISGTYTTSTSSASMVTSHSLGLVSLSVGTTYYYVVVSADSLGNISTSSEKTLITTSIPDSTSPTVSLTAPADASTVSGASVTLSATASDNISIAGVSFKVDGSLIGVEDTTSSYGLTWDSTSVADGSHVIVAVARDSSNNRATSSSATITVDNTAPVRSSGSPSSALPSGTTSTTLSLTTNESATCKYSTDSGTAYGSMTAFGSTNSSSHSTTISGLSDSTSYTYYVKCSDSQGNINATNYSINFSVSADVDAPVISSRSVGSITNTTAVVSWTTDELASSLVQFGLTSSLGSTTSEIDTSPRVTSHSISLSGLQSCTTYYYKVRSKDSELNTALSSLDSFSTTGCTGSASIEDITASSVTTASGGSVSLISGGKGPTLTIPAAFSGSDADFQIKKIDKTHTLSTTGSPTGLTLASDLLYDFKAYSDISTTISSFSEPITVVISYTNSDISSFSESSLVIKRWDGSSWNDLSSCSVNASSNTVSCTTTHFSVFGLFGIQSSQRSSGSRIIMRTPVPVPTTYKEYLTKPLGYGSFDPQVKIVQQVLNMNKDTQISVSGPGSMGKETLFYGTLTKKAIGIFQLKYGLVKTVNDPGYGRVGPNTRKKMNDLLNYK